MEKIKWDKDMFLVVLELDVSKVEERFVLV